MSQTVLTSKQLFSVTNSLNINSVTNSLNINSVTISFLEQFKSTPLPTVFSKQELPQKFSDFLNTKNATKREKLDSTVVSLRPVVERAFSGSILSSFETVSEQCVKLSV